MDSVDYLQFVNGNAQRSDQGVASLMQALQYRQQKEQQAQQMQRQQAQDAQAKQLHDLQVAKLQEEQQYQQGLKAAMAAPPTTSTLTQTTQQPLPSLASLGGNAPAPGNTESRQMVASTGSLAGLLANPEQPRPSLGSTQNPYQMAAEYAAKNGRYDEAAKLTGLVESNAKQKALLSRYGVSSLDDAYAAQSKEEQSIKQRDAVMSKAKEIAAMGDPKGAIDFFNKATGANLTYQGSKDDFIQIKDEKSGRIAAYNWRTGETKEIAQVTPKTEYKFREYTKGDKTVSEESQDGGLTWKPVASAPRYKPATTDGGGKPPAGYRWKGDGSLEPIPGGPASDTGGKGGKVLPASQLESIADMKRVKDVLAEANQELQKGTVATGPIAGRLQSVGAKVGLASDDFVNLQQKLQTAQNIMLKLRSGAAVTESEYARFLKEYPTPNDTPAVRDRKMQNTINYATTLMDEKMGIYEEGGYRVPQSVKSTNAKPASPAPAGKKRPLPKF